MNNKILVCKNCVSFNPDKVLVNENEIDEHMNKYHPRYMKLIYSLSGENTKYKGMKSHPDKLIQNAFTDLNLTKFKIKNNRKFSDTQTSILIPKRIGSCMMGCGRDNEILYFIEGDPGNIG